MHTIAFIQAQIKSVHGFLRGFADDLTETEWTIPAFPTTNPLGYTCWHMARSWDWAIQTVIRGVPEVIADERWASWSKLSSAGFGVGVTQEQANEIAHVVSQTDFLAYIDAVHTTVQDWLREMNEDGLDTIPDMEAHMAPYPAYQLPGSRAETDDLLGIPIWRLLSGVCIGHMRGHLGELDLLRQLLRERVV